MPRVLTNAEVKIIGATYEALSYLGIEPGLCNWNTMSEPDKDEIIDTVRAELEE
jgi:hypothetical protein